MKARWLWGLLICLSFLLGAGAKAERITLLSHGDESLAARLQAISEAKQSIDLATYVFHACDSSTKLLMKALFKKTAQGVKVRVVMDAFLLSTEDRANLQALFSRNRAQLKFFNNAHLVVNSNNRLHIKAMIIDGQLPSRTYFVGGRNATDEYYGLSSTLNLIDQDLMIKGASGATAQTYFNELWNSKMLSQVPAAGYITFPKFQKSCLKSTSRDQKVASYFAGEGAKLVSQAPHYECSKVEYAMDAPDFISPSYNSPRGEAGSYMNPSRLKRKRTTKLFMDFISKARGSLAMENQYYLPTHEMHEVFENLRRKKVRITVFANRTSDALGGMDAAMTAVMMGAARRDSKGTQAIFPISSLGVLNDRSPLSDPNAPWRIHTKSAVRDDQDVLISSFNIDPRSFHTNLESGVVVRSCPALARDVQRQYDSLTRIFRADQIACGACREEAASSGVLTHLKSFFGYDLF